MKAPILLEDFSFTYPAKGESQRALNSLNLSVEEGDFILLSGGSGSGKSSLLLALSGMIPHVTGGKVAGKLGIDGRDIRDYSPSDLSEKVGVAFQNPRTQLFTSTVKEEVAFSLQSRGISKEEMEKRINESLQFTGLKGYEDRAPGKLSGGEKQRLLLAILFAWDPPVYLLDEPLSALDPHGCREMIELLTKLNSEKGKTIIIAEKRVDDLLKRVGRVVLMKRGHILFDGATGDCLKQKELFEEASIPVLDSLLPVKKSDYVKKTANSPGDLSLNELTFAYPGGQNLFEKSSYLFKGGDVTALVGANGSGKTTLASLIMGLLIPLEGSISLYSKDISRLSIARRSHQIGYLFQNPDNQLFSPSVAQEIGFGLKNLDPAERKQRIKRSLNLFNLQDLADSPPSLLSFAFRKRVALASLYAMEPDFSILDEPDWGQDNEGLDMIRRFTDEVTGQGRGIILISHNRALAYSLMDNIIELDGGVL